MLESLWGSMYLIVSRPRKQLKFSKVLLIIVIFVVNRKLFIPKGQKVCWGCIFLFHNKGSSHIVHGEVYARGRGNLFQFLSSDKRGYLVSQVLLEVFS